MPNESAKIILAATHGKLTKVRDCLLIEDSINSIQCQFEFRTSDWDNTTKTAVFFRGWATPSTPDADTIYVILDESNTCYIPSEILNKNTLFSVGVFGTSDDYRIVSNWMYYKIKDGCFAEGSSPSVSAPSAYEQLLKELENHQHDDMYYTKDESEDRFVSQEEINNLVATPDWNQNDENTNDYIKNRTHYTTIEKQENELGVFEDSNITVTQMSDNNLGTCTLDASAWTEDVDNADRIAFVYESPTQMIYIKCNWINAGWWKDETSGITIEDYVVGVDRKYIVTNLPVGAVGENTNHISLTFSKTTDIEVVTQLDEKYIPNTIARASDIPTKTSDLTNDTELIVTFSGDGSSLNPYACTNTYSEIESAYNFGKKIIGKLNNFGFNKNGGTISYGNIDLELTNIMDEATFKGYYAEFMFTLICRVLYNDSVSVELIPIITSSDSYGGIKADEKQVTDTIPARIGTDGKLYVEHTQSDWDATEGSTQILNKPTKLSQFEGEMTAEEQAAVRENIGINELSSNEVYVMDESDTEADIPENAELIIIPDENGDPTEYVTVEMLNNIIPTVTSDDNGKFLRVSGGKIVCESLPIAEEASF